MDLVERVGRRTRELRQERCLTLDQLADLSGVRPERISRIERGRTAPTLGTLARIAHGLGVPVTTLVSTDEPADDLRGDLAAIVALLRPRNARLLRTARRLVEVLLEEETPHR